jgi:hypothetical protein
MGGEQQTACHLEEKTLKSRFLWKPRDNCVFFWEFLGGGQKKEEKFAGTRKKSPSMGKMPKKCYFLQ